LTELKPSSIRGHHCLTQTTLAAGLSNGCWEPIGCRQKKWTETANHPRWNRLYAELTYQPMLEVLRNLRDSAYKTYIMTLGEQDFVRVYSDKVLWHPSRAVVGTAGGTKYGYGKDGKPFLTKEPKLLLNDDTNPRAST
jgi:hypothetical protein